MTSVGSSNLSFFLCVLCTSVCAEPAELTARYTHYSVAYTVNADGTSTATYDREVKILQQRAVERQRQTSVNYSTSVQRADVLEAYTLKLDGRRIDAPKSNYQLEINKGREENSPAFSDNTELSVIFPDVAVGDVVVIKYTIKTTDTLFPGHFSVNDRFNKLIAYDDVMIRIDAPATMWSQYSTTGLTEVRNEVPGSTVDGGDRRILEWSWKNPEPQKSKRRDYSAYDADSAPGYSFSTFRNYEEIARAYGSRAAPKSVVSDRVRALADELTKGIIGPREQAKILYEWVSTNIGYAGNCVGVGAVVPRDQAFVLDNKLGDCKDHATLLQAMLAAKGIQSTQALVNAGGSYHLPKIPVVSMVNHVIVYVPILDLFLDSTSSITPFGMLPIGDCDKPVLLVDGYREGLRTPPTRADRTRQLTRTDVTVRSDGSIAGAVKVASTGMFAAGAREHLRNASASDREQLMDAIYRRDRKSGFGRLESDDPKPLMDSFNYTVQFETEEFVRLPGPGAFSVEPLFPIDAPLKALISQTEDEPEAPETYCSGGFLSEEYVYHLPKNMKIMAVPKGVTVASGNAAYRSSYVLKGNTLTVMRDLDDRTSRNICPVSQQHEFAALARKAAQDLKAQVVYR